MSTSLAEHLIVCKVELETVKVPAPGLTTGTPLSKDRAVSNNSNSGCSSSSPSVGIVRGMKLSAGEGFFLFERVNLTSKMITKGKVFPRCYNKATSHSLLLASLRFKNH